ncbi:MAG: cybB [Gammaproteobacteria bacterium]|jgi:cytochrome b561|nr:cybB [Gammaproteobacteria bacterium]
MEIKNDSQHYGIVEKILHWLMALLIILMLSVSFFFDDFSKTTKSTLIGTHKLIGMSIFLLAIIFLIWKKINIKPAFPENMPRWQTFLARFVHHLLMLAIIIMPLAGWIMSTAAGKPPKIGTIALNFPGIPLDKTLSGFCWNIHLIVAWLLIGLISLHVLGALKHALIDKDGILRRMGF